LEKRNFILKEEALVKVDKTSSSSISKKGDFLFKPCCKLMVEFSQIIEKSHEILPEKKPTIKDSYSKNSIKDGSMKNKEEKEEGLYEKDYCCLNF